MPIEGDARRLERFELVAELATGGMATVYLARLSGVGGFQRFVAIKRLHPHLAREPEFIEMFLEEARLAARIHHPNVVSILEIGTSDQGYYIVMEYVEGDTLGRLLARSAQGGERLPMKVGLRVVIDMLSGLHAAHDLTDDEGKELGIVHRDISPQNVLVGVDGTVRLSDFGVARATSKLSTTRSGQLKGKLAYMAPEQAKGAKDIDRRADIFASGIVLWEVLACRRLFKGDGDADTLNRVLHEPIPPIRGALPTVPAALEAVLAKALDRERTRRYATAADFAEALERAARVIGALGTSKDVAAHVEAVLGTEISQQREAVRAWVARSEPSHSGLGGKPGGRDATSVTQVQGRGLRGHGPEPTPISSVTSAVISNTPAPLSPAPASDPVASQPPRRSRAWPWIALPMTVVLLSVFGWLRWKPAAGPFEPTSSMGAATAAPATVASTSFPVATVSSLAAQPSAAPSGSGGEPSPALTDASAAANLTTMAPTRTPAHPPLPHAVATRLSPVNVPVVPTAAPSTPVQSQPSATVPEDILRNPYR